jgi:hypothetical protein
MHSAHIKKMLELNWKWTIYLFHMKSSLFSSNKESQSCLGTFAFHDFVPAFTHNIHNFECTQWHCSLQNENVSWLLINVHPKNLNLKVWRDLFFNDNTKLQCIVVGDKEVTSFPCKHEAMAMSNWVLTN